MTTKKPAKTTARAPAKTAAAAKKAKTPAARGAHALLAQAHKFPPHQLERAMPYLLARAGERMGNTFSKELRPFKLTLNEWRTCVALHLEAHQRLSEIAA